MFQSYHLAWLETHPHRSMAWLLFQMREGFDIHHVDGDHSNDAPENLVLIEHSDHMAIHNGGTVFVGRLAQRRGPRPRRTAPKRQVARRSRWDRHRLEQIERCVKNGEPVPGYLLS